MSACGGENETPRYINRTMSLWKKLLWIAVTLLGLGSIAILAMSRGEQINALWIIVAGVLLTGIVALNVAVLRLNIRLDHMNNQSQQLQAENAALGAKLSAAVSSPRIQALAKARGFVPADPMTIGYVDIAPRGGR